jgi:hypothetical protein
MYYYMFGSSIVSIKQISQLFPVSSVMSIRPWLHPSQPLGSLLSPAYRISAYRHTMRHGSVAIRTTVQTKIRADDLTVPTFTSSKWKEITLASSIWFYSSLISADIKCTTIFLFSRLYDTTISPHGTNRAPLITWYHLLKLWRLYDIL